jgi:hypothetical protein
MRKEQIIAVVSIAAAIAFVMAGSAAFGDQKVVEWSFEDNLSDTSGNGNDGSYYDGSGPDYTDGVIGKCLELTTEGEYIEKLGAVNLPTEVEDTWSINMYVKPSGVVPNWWAFGGMGAVATPTYNPLHTRYITSHHEDATLAFYRTPNMATTAVINADTWQMLTATYDGQAYRMYKNGEQVAYYEQTAIAPCAAEIRIAPDFWGEVGHFVGQIDEFTIWDGALSQAELDAMVQQLPTIPSRVLHWSGEMSEGKFIDESGHGNDGLITGDVVAAQGLVGDAIQINPGANWVMNEACSNLPLAAEDSWSMNFYAKFDSLPANWAQIGGFGSLNNGGAGLRDSRNYVGYDQVRMEFHNNPEATISGANWDTGIWHMATAVYDGGTRTLYMYKNGALVYSLTGDIMDLGDASAFPKAALGWSQWVQGYGTTALIDEFCIWNYAISAGDISTLASRLPAEKVLHWNFDEFVNEEYQEAIPYSSIENVLGSTGDEFYEERVPENIVNGSGMSGLTHNNNHFDCWINRSDSPLPLSSALPGVLPEGPAWIAIQFDQAYPLGEMWVWNYNQASGDGGGTARGMRWVTINYSADGSTWETLGDFEFARATGESGYEHNTVVDFGGVNAAMVVITARAEDNDGDGFPDGQWSGEWMYGCGLAELRFGIAGSTVTNTYVSDVSGNGNDGEIAGSPAAVAGNVGDAFDFAAGDSVSKASAANLPLNKAVAWSINTWLKAAAQPASPTVIGGFGGYGGTGQTTRYISYEGELDFWDYPIGHSEALLDINKWQMVTVTYDTDIIRLYKNGIEIAAAEANINGNATALAQLCPVDPFGEGNEFIGQVDDFSIWTGALSAEQIKTLYLAGDFNNDGTVDLLDYPELSVQWLTDNLIGEYSQTTVDDFESYADVLALEEFWYNWYDAPGVSAIDLINDAQQANNGDKALRWSYDNSAAVNTYSEIVLELPAPYYGNVNLSEFDQIRMSIYRHAGNSTEDIFYIKILNSGMTTSDIAAEFFIDGSTTGDQDWVDLTILTENLEYPSWSAQANGYDSLDDITAVTGMLVGCYTAQTGGTGTIDIDDISIVAIPECSQTPDTDLSGDCVVDSADIIIFAENWLTGTN